MYAFICTDTGLGEHAYIQILLRTSTHSYVNANREVMSFFSVSSSIQSPYVTSTYQPAYEVKDGHVDLWRKCGQVFSS